jgi:predicted MFS family arabinose efflux permease
MIVASVGATGAILAHFIADAFDWRMCYYIGGGLGLVLLALRIGVVESGMYHQVKSNEEIKRGNFFLLFKNKKRALKYLNSILIGVPVWYTIGVFIYFSPEINKEVGVFPEVKTASQAVMWCYLGLAMGDFIGGWLSQYFQSRKKVILSYLLALIPICGYYLYGGPFSDTVFYVICFLIGTFTGYWVLFCTTAAEQFGTNIRATAATTVPNFVRGSVVPLTLLFSFLGKKMSLIHSASIVGAIALSIALFSLYHLNETFGKELNFIDE